MILWCCGAVRKQAQAALSEVRVWAEQNGLELNADKTHVGDCRQAGQGFEFLGYRFEVGRRWVRRKSLLALRERIRHKTRRTREDSLTCMIAISIPCCVAGFTTSSIRNLGTSVDR